MSKTVHFPNLDILRMVAAMLIVVAHGYEAWIGWGHSHPFLEGVDGKELSSIGEWVHRAIKNFTIGVDVFFVISGFLITYLLLVEKETTGRVHFVKFYLRRTLRIWPLYFLLIAMAPLLVQWNGQLYFEETKSVLEVHPDYLGTALFVNNFSAIARLEWTFPFAHFWSICIEEHFYIFWPLLVAFVPKRRLPVVLLVIIVLSMGTRAYFQFVYPYPFWQNYLHTMARMDMLAIGALIAWIHQRKPIVLPIHWGIRIPVYLAFLWVMCHIGWQPVDGSYMSQVFTKHLFGVFFIFWILNYMFNPHAWLAFRKKNPFHYLGKISYGLYMYHNVLVSFVILLLVQPYDFDDADWWKFWLVYLGATILISALSFELFEKHFLRWKERFAVIFTRR